MNKRSTLFFLTLILTLDLLFFGVIAQRYPQIFEALLDLLPFNNHIETAVILVSGLIVAIVSSIAIVRMLISGLGEVLG